MTFRYDPAAKRAKVTIYAGRDHLGRQRQRSRTWASPNERQARREAAKHEATLRGEVDDRRERGKTLNGLIDDWQEIRDAKDSPSTVRKRAGMLNRIRAGLGPIRLDELTSKHVDRWMAAMRADVDELGERRFTDTTIRNHWSMLRAILNQGDMWDAVTDRATKKAKPPKRVSNRRPTPPTAAAARVLIEAAAPDLRVAASIAAYGGLRRGEVVALRWVDVEPGVLHVRHALVDIGAGRHHVKLPKSDQPRDVVIDRDLHALLLEHRADLEARAAELGAVLADDAYLLPRLVAPPNARRVPSDPAGTIPRPLGWVTLAWSRHAARHGAPDVHFHDLRHYFATELLDAGVPLKVVQEQLGHLQAKTTTDIYAHSAEGAKVAAAEVFRQRRALPAAT